MAVAVFFESNEPTSGIWLARNEHGGFETLEPEHLKDGAEIRNEAPAGYSHFRITKVLDDGRFKAVQVVPDGNTETYNFQLLIEA
jgi:hypothetical protein